MATLFSCDVCEKVYSHPDIAIDCEASHYDAWGVCPKCDQNRPFDKLGDKKFVCRECKLIVKCVLSFCSLIDIHDQEVWHAKHYHIPKLEWAECVWLQATQNGADKAIFYEGELKEVIK